MNNETAFESLKISKRNCLKCPIEWCDAGGGHIVPDDPTDTVCIEFSEFDLWMDAKHDNNKKERSELADQIANKEWTDKYTIQNADISHED